MRGRLWISQVIAALSASCALGTVVDYAKCDAKCPGTTAVNGYGQISLVNARWNRGGDQAGDVDVVNGAILARMKGRSYFGVSCAGGGPGTWQYSNTEYAAMQLLGKTLRYTIDLSGAGCGCNAALYLTSLRQNGDKSLCSDHYCDAAKVCGVACVEIDIQEANQRAWYTTFHTADDAGGFGKGYGAGRREWNASVYGPGARCVDTMQPISVAASFPTDASGNLLAMEVTLSQSGRPCQLGVRLEGYRPMGRDGMGELSEALRAGMTPIISYWGISENMGWMDGKGGDSLGPCAAEAPEQCAESVTFSGFSLEDLPSAYAVVAVADAPAAPTEPPQLPAPTAAPVYTTRAPQQLLYPTTIPAAAPAPAPQPQQPQASDFDYYYPRASDTSAEQQQQQLQQQQQQQQPPDLQTLPATSQAAAAGAAPAPVPPPVAAPVPVYAPRVPVAVPAATEAPSPQALAPAAGPPPGAPRQVDHLVMPWVVVVLGGAILIAIVHYRYGDKRYDPLDQSAQAGDEVLVRSAFEGKGRWMGTAVLVPGTRGVILEIEHDGAMVIRFEQHQGHFKVLPEELYNLEWRPRQRPLMVSPPSP